HQKGTRRLRMVFALGRRILITFLMVLIFVPSADATGFFLQGERVYITHPQPRTLLLHHGNLVVSYINTKCVQHFPHVMDVWYITTANATTDYAAIWYCGARHVRSWIFS